MAKETSKLKESVLKDFRYRVLFDEVNGKKKGEVCEWYELAGDLTGLVYLLNDAGAIEQTTAYVTVGTVVPTTDAEWSTEKETLIKRLVDTQSELDALSVNLEELDGKLDEAERANEEKESELEDLRGKVQDFEAKIAELETELKKLKK